MKQSVMPVLAYKSMGATRLLFGQGDMAPSTVLPVPSRGATIPRYAGYALCGISTHTPLAGRDLYGFHIPLLLY